MKRVLVANRAEIAARIQETCRALGLETVAVFSDADAHLPYVRSANRAVRLPGCSPADTYLNAAAMLDAAARTGADVVHPGYGFLAENADFAEAVIQRGLTWVGPPPEAMRRLGDKSAARRLAMSVGVPVVPGSEGDDTALRAAASSLGFPLLVKAAHGGGGRGMRRVENEDELDAALESARREAESAFGDGRLLVERCIERPRHVEVQVFGDTHGQVLALGERDCSVQRRHQKVFEESPAPGLDRELAASLHDAAVRVARAVGYVGAGTVEFLVDRDGSYFFLETNTRLQVEHPVTEAVTGLDLVALQLEVADGQRLTGLPEPNGHAIEARIYAEDPNRDYRPSTGKLLAFDLPWGGGVRVDSGFEAGNTVSPHYDALLAKVIASGPTREVALRRLSRALHEIWIPGVVTNLPLLRDVVDDPEFCAGHVHTSFLADRGLPKPPPANATLGVLAGVVSEQQALSAASWARLVAPGWRLEGSASETSRWSAGGSEMEVTTRQSSDVVEVRIEGETHRVRWDGSSVEVDGVRERWRILRSGDQVFVHAGDRESMARRLPRFPPPVGAEADPGSCTAPTPGTVVAVHVSAGEEVAVGRALVTIEAMKTEVTLTAPVPGRVASVRVAPGKTVDQGALLVQIDVAS